MPQALEPALAERVLARLGFRERPEPDLDGLRALYSAWCRQVPWDNFMRRVQVANRETGRYPGTLVGEFFRDWLAHGVGGTCWANGGALRALLRELGFDAHNGLGTMTGGQPNLGNVPNHSMATVRLDGRWYLVDGSLLHMEPLLLPRAGSSAVKHPAWGVSCTYSLNLWHVRFRPFNRDASLMRLQSTQIAPELFEAEAVRERAATSLRYMAVARICRDDGVTGLLQGRRVRIAPDGKLGFQPLPGQEWRRCLVEDFGISEEFAARMPEDQLDEVAKLKAAGESNEWG